MYGYFWWQEKQEIQQEKKANEDISALFEKMKPGMYLNGFRKVKHKNGSYINVWHPGDDGKVPLAQKFVKKDKNYCVFTVKRKHVFSGGDYMYYAWNATNLVGVTIDKKHCYDDNAKIKSIYLMKNSGYVLKKKTYEDYIAKNREKLNASLDKAKKENKLLMLVLYHPSVKKVNAPLKKLLKRAAISKLIKNKVILFEYKENYKKLGFDMPLYAFPAILFLNGEGKIIYKPLFGTPEEEDFKRALESI